MIPKKTLIVVSVAVLAFAYYGYRTQRKNDTTNSAFTNIIGGAINLINGGVMTISQSGRAAIQQREGYENIVYADAGGRATAGVGHLLLPADGYNIGDYVPDTVIQAWFNADISHAENIIARYVAATLNQNQVDALGSAVFNLGSRFFINADGSKTQVLADINAGNMQSAAAQFPRWDHVDGLVLPGLETRRIAEMHQFLA